MIPKTSNRWPKRTVEDFFDSWNPNMAYVLGYFAADGTMYKNKRGSHYIAFTSTDAELIKDVKSAMNASNAVEKYDHPGKLWKTRFTLQVGSKKIYQRFLELGLTPKKSLTLTLPNIPNDFLGHFLRGYFDGDGCVSFALYKRKDRSGLRKIFNIRLRCGSKSFVEALRRRLTKVMGVEKGSLYFHSRAYELVYSTKNVIKLFRFMYPGENLLCLERKFKILKEGINSLGS